jgi:pro-sigmaK processing inhibitor BofA
MNPDKIIYIIMGVVTLIMIIFIARSERPILAAGKGIIPGGLLLLVIHYCGAHFGIILPINIITGFCGIVLGIPGVAAVTLIENVLR